MRLCSVSFLWEAILTVFFQCMESKATLRGPAPMLQRNKRHLSAEWQQALVISAASGRPLIHVNPRVSAQLWLCPWRPCLWKGSAARHLGCILLPSFDCKVLNGEDRLSSFVFQTCSADDCGHPGAKSVGLLSSWRGLLWPDNCLLPIDTCHQKKGKPASPK